MDIKKQLTIPNLLTLLRLIGIPFMAYLIYRDARPIAAFVLFAAIWSTDCLDGYIARRYHQVSDVGKIMDPAVDKLFQLTTAVMMCWVGRLPLWVPLFIFFKEILMVIGGAVLLKQKTVVSAEWFGKVTTGLFVLAFSCLFFLPPEQLHWANALFILPCLCSLYSLFRYTWRYFVAPKRASRMETDSLHLTQ